MESETLCDPCGHDTSCCDVSDPDSQGVPIGRGTGLCIPHDQCGRRNDIGLSKVCGEVFPHNAARI